MQESNFKEASLKDESLRDSDMLLTQSITGSMGKFITITMAITSLSNPVLVQMIFTIISKIRERSSFLSAFKRKFNERTRQT
jgi:hypothetical protein